MFQRYFWRVALTLSIPLLLAATTAFAAGGQASANQVTIAHMSSGTLLVTVQGDQTSLSLRYFPLDDNYNAPGCQLAPGKPRFPCYHFEAGAGVADVPITGCPHPRGSGPSFADCPVAGVKVIKIVLKNGTSLDTEHQGDPYYAPNGNKKHFCFPASVSVVARGSYMVDVSDKECQETVSCPGVNGTVTADRADDVKASCSAEDLAHGSWKQVIRGPSQGN